MLESLEDRRLLAAGSLAALSSNFAAPSITRQGNTATTISDLEVGGETYDVEFTGNVTFNAQFGSDPVPGTPPFYFGDASTAQAFSNAVAAVLHADGTLSSVGVSSGDSDASGLFPASASATTHTGFDIGYGGQGAWGGGASYNAVSRNISGVFALVTLANPPSVTLSVNNASIPESGGLATLTATLSEASSQAVTVELGFTGTATNVDDYTRSSAQIVIAAGNTTGTVTVTAVHDTLDETHETVIVDITGATNATESAPQQQTITILDDDDPSATVTGTVLNGGQPNRSGIAGLMQQFSESVTVSSPEALQLRNHSTGAVVDISGATLSGNGTNAIVWDLSPVTLPAGFYTATLPKSAGLAVTHSELFFVQPGDTDGDTSVGFADFGLLASNFNGSVGSYGPGDMDGDGSVGFGDFGILASNFNAGVTEPPKDAGDASGTYPTAEHITGSGLSLGGSVGGANDGVTFGTLQAGNNAATITVNATIPSGGNASLNAFIDFNNDGDWDDAGEQILVDQALVSGANSLTVAIPAGATVGTANARFRVSSIDGYGPGGLAVDGEVEDYSVTIASALSRSFGRRLPSSVLDFWTEAVADGTGQTAKSSPVFSNVTPTTTDVVDAAIKELSSPREHPVHPSSTDDLIDRVFEDGDLPLLDNGLDRTG